VYGNYTGISYIPSSHDLNSKFYFSYSDGQIEQFQSTIIRVGITSNIHARKRSKRPSS